MVDFFGDGGGASVVAVKIEEREDLLSGMIKFENVGHEELCKYAKSLLEGPNGAQFSNVHVRSTSSKQCGISFMYKLRHESANSALWNIKDAAMKKFGAKFVGWDIGKKTWLITK